MLVLALWGCDGGGDPTTTVPLPELQGIVAVLRWLDDGSPVQEADATAGQSSPAHPDSGGGTYFFDLLPARLPLTAVADGGITTTTTPDVVPGAVSGTHLAFLPRPLGLTVSDPTVAVLDGEVVTEPYDLVIVEPTEAQRAAIPGDQLSLRNDVEVGQVRILHVVSVQALRREDLLSVAQDVDVTLTFDLPASSPVWADPDNARVWRYSPSAGYWVGGVRLQLDEATSTGTALVGSLGWIAIALEAPDRPCRQGRAVSAGEPLGGVEIRAFQDGLFGVDRVTTLVDGTFCLPTDDGATTTFRALGFDNTRTAMYVGGGTSSGAIGDVQLEAFADDDQDRTFDGPGGDCDDSDPEVGPNPGLADGTWCGEPL